MEYPKGCLGKANKLEFFSTDLVDCSNVAILIHRIVGNAAVVSGTVYCQNTVMLLALAVHCLLRCSHVPLSLQVDSVLWAC